MKKFSKQFTFYALFMALMLGSVASTSTQATTNVLPRPISLSGPRGDVPLFSWLKGSMIPILFGMHDANFSSGDVLYSQFNTQDQLTQVMPPVKQNSSINLDISTFKTNLANYISNHTHLASVYPILQDLLTQIGTNSNLTVAKNTYFAPVKLVDRLSHFVVFLYDPDHSVINAMNDIRANKTLTSQPFTGDEVITSVRMDRNVENIYGTFAGNSILEYGNGTTATAFMQFGAFLRLHPFYAQQLISDLNASDLLQSIRSFATPPFLHVIGKANPIKNVNVGFTVSQMQIDNLTLAKKFGNVIISNFDATLVESSALGMTLFNDTNNNGIMDLAMRTIQSNRPGLNGTVVPSGSAEAVYRVDVMGADSSTYVPVAKTSGQNELSFSFNATNVHVNLNPVSENQDDSLVNPQSPVPETISNVGYTFHFTTNETNHSANVKFDYELGTWSNQTAVNGLSLNQMYLTGVQDFSIHHRVMDLQHNNQAVNDNGQAVAARKFSITAGQSPIASIDLDQIPYTYNGATQEQAYGQTLPLLFTNFMFGALSANQNTIRTLGGGITSTRYLYSISYPEFNGNSISHDPTFSVVASNASSTNTTVTSGVPGFEVLSILALPVIFVVRKRKAN